MQTLALLGLGAPLSLPTPLCARALEGIFEGGAPSLGVSEPQSVPGPYRVVKAHLFRSPRTTLCAQAVEGGWGTPNF